MGAVSLAPGGHVALCMVCAQACESHDPSSCRPAQGRNGRGGRPAATAASVPPAVAPRAPLLRSCAGTLSALSLPPASSVGICPSHWASRRRATHMFLNAFPEHLWGFSGRNDRQTHGNKSCFRLSLGPASCSPYSHVPRPLDGEKKEGRCCAP